MKERRDYVEEEAREYHSECVGPVVRVYQEQLSQWAHTGLIDQAFIAEARHDEERYRPELRRSAIGYKQLKNEFNCSWTERRPCSRRESIWTAMQGGWEPEDGLPDDDGMQQDVDKCDWFQGIHEGRYYLFWHKDSFREATKYTHWSCVASIDINIVEGRTLENPWGNQACPDICWDPKYLREGGKEKKHIDDMFIKE